MELIEISGRIIDFIEDLSEGKRVYESARLEAYGEVGLDSLGLVELKSAIEDEFGISISSEDAERLQLTGTVKDLADYVARHTNF